MLKKLYQTIILKYPLRVLLVTLSAILLFGVNISKLEIDASAETLLLEDDKDLAFLHTLEKRFKTDDALIVAYEPKHTTLLSDESLQTLQSLTQALTKLPMVTSVDSLLNVPLLYSPLTDMETLLHQTRTLQTKDTNRTLAKNEFLTNPLYKDSLVNKDFTLSSILIHLKKDTQYNILLEQRSTLFKKQKTSTLSAEEEKELRHIIQVFKKHRDAQRLKVAKNIHDIRTILSHYKKNATLYLGGVQMISNDIVDFVKNDLSTYGTILILLLIIILGIVFRKPRWIFIPIIICTLSVIAITSALGYWGWEITVISSNFIALQLIITISIVLHLIVRYEELSTSYPRASKKRIILLTMLSKVTPTFFAIITTIAGFSSLLFSHIYPIINLGWMMSAGIVLSFIISFIVFPTVLMLLKKSPAKKKKRHAFSLAKLSSHIVLHDKKVIFAITLLSIIFSVTGASHLIVENSFINYFKKDTSIYKGMKVIDQELGGTTPLDVVLTFKEDGVSVSTQEEEEDSFENEFNEEENQEQYWFTDEKIAIIHQVQDYLYTLKDTGDVRSFATILDTGKILNKGKALDSVEIALLYNKLPQKYRDIILSPYVDIAHNQVRFSTRIKDSNEGLRRNELLHKIKNDLAQFLNPNVVTFRLSNLMVIYNNMLQSLFTSQITTLSLVLVILFVMFLLLFRSVWLTLIALMVNIIPIGIIFGFMGWLHIPLDIMTITIAAIAMGIGVDDTIHYIHRFKEEFNKDKNYIATMQRTNESIGYAMVYTSITVIIGFSILILSNLVPTIYFGLLTMLVMVAALISNLILLPKLLLLINPLKKDATIKKIKNG
jgi:predicted RND superfamily exporter protein